MGKAVQLYTISQNDLENCLKCSICTIYCPVTAVTTVFPGPKHAGPDGERYRLKNPKYFDDTLKYCLNCKRCEVACPSGVKIGDIIQSARIKYDHHAPKLRDRLLANTDFMGTVATKMSRIVNGTLKLSVTKRLMDATLAIDHKRTFPAYTGRTFEKWYQEVSANQSEFTRQVSYFHGCYVNYNYPKLGKDLVKILNAIGYGVQLLDKEKCCGVALIANNMSGQAKRQGEHNIALCRQAVKRGQEVLTTSTTCTFTIRDEYPHLLGIDNQDVRPHINLATRFIYQLLDAGKIKLAFRDDYKKRIAYHTACHMERLGWSIYSTEMMRKVPGVELTILPSQCCGIAGTYGFKKENYANSQLIGAELFRHIRDVAPNVVATDCETCKWQIEMSTGFEVQNPISILADALDVEQTKKLNQNK